MRRCISIFPAHSTAAGRASDLDSAKKAFFASGLDLVACFNDPMPGNFLVKEDGDGRLSLKMVDYELYPTTSGPSSWVRCRPKCFTKKI